MKRYIGGFLEFELFPQSGPSYHAKALAFHNARACLSHVIGQTAMQAVWLPYYTCNALLEPFEAKGVPYHFYSLSEELEILDLPELSEGQYLIYVNYFGLKYNCVNRLLEHYGNQLLVDNTQDYFVRGYDVGWSFNSARKSFGVPDGGYLYGPEIQIGTNANYPINTTYHAQYLIDRLRGAQSEAYHGFVEYERTLTANPLQISELSVSLLSQVDYAMVMARRRDNYRRYHAALGSLNTLPILLELDELPSDTVPFCYPLLLINGESFNRRALFEQNIFVAWFWPDVLTRQPDGYSIERHLTQALLPLPVDHRYGPAEIDRVITVIRKLLLPAENC